MATITITKSTASPNTWVAVGPGTSMSDMDTAMCYYDNTGATLSHGCEDYFGVGEKMPEKDKTNDLTYLSTDADVYTNVILKWVYKRPLTATTKDEDQIL